MLTVYNCIVNEHDLRLVVLAAAICALASFAAITLLHHVRKSTGHMRHVWLAVSATSSGFGIWATHFIAMLAFSPGIPNGYNITLTFLSLMAAIVLTGVGLAVALAKTLPGAAWLGGAIVGGGIATMHYTGMAAFEVEGRIIWDPTLVVASIALGALIGAVSLPTGLRDGSIKWKICGALLLTVAICSHHFTAMGAVSIMPDPAIEVSKSALPASWLAIAVALASFGIILLAFAGVALDIRDRRRSEMEADRMRGLANAAVEGLLVCQGEIIVTVNNSFAALTGSNIEEMVGAKLDRYFPDEVTRLRLLGQPTQPIEAELRLADGSETPVELILHPVDFAGKPHHAIAVRDLRARKQAEQKIRFLAHNDALTELPNRSSFDKRLDHEIEAALINGRRFAVLCLDLDRFKEVNDLFGHAAGDALLQTVAKCVTGLLDPSHMMARLGGDEFAIIVPALANPIVAGRIAEDILEALRALSEGSASGALVSSSIGIAIYPNDATDRQTLLSHADTALYRAKVEGRGTYRFFETSMGAQVRDRRLLEHDLRHAISRRELSLVYQPQTDIKTDQVIGFEALLRWNHATRGEISPTIFIPIAEESGAILQIGEWVLRTACREAASWTQPLTLAVNISAVQLHSSNFSHLLHDILFHSGLLSQRLELEITETALVRDLNRALSTLRQLKTLGVRIAMDDFGTGYSSLSNLRSFPFDKIKIDGSFIKAVDSNEQAATIVRAVLGLGRGLGLPVLAEGVETSGELAFLVNELCNEAQGYLLGRPAQIEQFRHLTHDVALADDPANVTHLAPERRLNAVSQ
ncbi:MAG TPA: EAL domain-containing protein [Bradyrhizobium sp.]|nr:EAL domain-containing protein [Bradyrhizobium sp.]